MEVCIPGYEDEPYEKMEKQRFTVALPGDYQEEVLRLAKLADRRAASPQSGNVACRLYFVDPASQYPALVGQAASWMLPIVGFYFFLQGLDLVARLRGKKRNMRQEVAASFGKSRAARTSGMGRGNTGVLFADVAGQEPAISAFREIIDMMLGDQRFVVAGAKLPKGVLLEGPPGTGKTLLAKAVAGEAGVPFFSANGSEFVEMFVGVAAARVRDLFGRARASAPSIIFIDEIDTIGRARTGSSTPDAKEREQGLLQLLVEMDGFETKRTGVLLIAATNRKEVLDPALLRSGRFDRVIRMGLPSLEGRQSVLEVHAEGKIVPRGKDSVSEDFPDGDAVLRTTALLTQGYSGADLANLLNEAAILAVRRNKPLVEMAEVETAMEKLTVGLPRAPLQDSAYKHQLAWVYAGRAVLQTAVPHLWPDVLQVSVAPRGSSVARIDSLPSERAWGRAGAEASLRWSDLVERLAVGLAGRATEEEVFGAAAASSVTAPDLVAVTDVAAQMVGQSGLFRRRGSPVPFHLLSMPEHELPKWPGAVAEAMDAAVRETVDEAFARARAAVRTLRPAIDALAEELLASETVYGARVRSIVRDSPRVMQPLSAFALEAPDFEYPPHSMGAATFSRWSAGPGRVGVASFGRSVAASWLHAQQLVAALPLPPAPPVMGLAGFSLAPGPGRVGLTFFHGWEVDHVAEQRVATLLAAQQAQEAEALAAGARLEQERAARSAAAVAAAEATRRAEEARMAAERAAAVATADAEAHARAAAETAAAAAREASRVTADRDVQ